MCALVFTEFVMLDQLYKYPRLYLNAHFEENAVLSFDTGQAHYLKHVLRKDLGDLVRVFNGVDGEWLATLTDLGKKAGSAVLRERVRAQPALPVPVCLFFSPIRKQRMDFLIEKAVELGVSGLYPVLMNRTEARTFNEKRVRAQIVEAAEQCGRMDLPALSPVQKFPAALAGCAKPLYVCLEWDVARPALASYSYAGGAAFMIGPEGGFDAQEVDLIFATEDANPVSLGETILRAETAALACLSYARLCGG